MDQQRTTRRDLLRSHVPFRGIGIATLARATALALLAGGLTISLVGAACGARSSDSGNTFAAQPAPGALDPTGQLLLTALLLSGIAAIALGQALLRFASRRGLDTI